MSKAHQTASYTAAARIMRPRIQAQIDAGGSPCVQRPCRMGGLVLPGEVWDLGHIVSAMEGKAMGWTPQQINALTNFGAAHRHENRSDGAKANRANQIKTKQTERRMFT